MFSIFFMQREGGNGKILTICGIKKVSVGQKTKTHIISQIKKEKFRTTKQYYNNYQMLKEFKVLPAIRT